MAPKPSDPAAAYERRVDPDLGATPKTPSVEQRMAQAELAARALKLQHMQKQAAMTEAANLICAFPTSMQ